MKCPKCGLEQPESSIECPKCQLIFSKLQGQEIKQETTTDLTQNISYPTEDSKFQKKLFYTLTFVLLGIIVMTFWSIKFTKSNKDLMQITPNETVVKKDSIVPSVKGSKSTLEKIVLISKGERVSLEDYLTDGYIVIFDFYADWCGPCRALAPKIEQLVNQNNDVLLRKINIVDWRSEVTRQYKINFVPNVWVYNKKGVLVGAPTADYNVIVQYVNQSK